MGIAKKYRRKITVGERDYMWYVIEDLEDFPQTVDSYLHALNIISNDKKFIVRYHLHQRDPERRHITVIGPEFGGVLNPSPYKRFLCPDWCPEGAMTPGIVREVIEWCAEPSSRVEVDWTGSKV